MKNVYLWIFVAGLLVVCGYLVYKLGISHCRTETAEAAVAQVATVRKTGEEITQMVMAVPDVDVLDWLLREYRRAD
jgi:TRAP-type mannitol/chloroaromatic compound transport system permease large subunit